jgi:hypothetical protein
MPGRGDQLADVAVLGAERLELALDGGDPALELVD